MRTPAARIALALVEDLVGVELAIQLVKFTIMVEPLFRGEDLAHHVEPFEPLLVAAIMFGRRMSKHVELALIPSGHDVQSSSTAADVIDRYQRLGREHRMH